MNKRVSFLGAGNMAEALIKGLLCSGLVDASRISVSDALAERLSHLASTYDVRVFSSNRSAAASSDVVFLTVKPVDVATVIGEVAEELAGGDKLVVSVAAGITTGFIAQAISDAGVTRPVPIVRAMPNTPALIREGAVGLYAAPGIPEDMVSEVVEIFKSVGIVKRLDDEALLDVVTGLSGSGPAYIFYFMEALVEAGVRAGLDHDTAKALVLQTTLGAAMLARQSTQPLEELRKMVTSPKGTTFEAVKELESSKVGPAIISAVDAAIRRAKELASGK